MLVARYSEAHVLVPSIQGMIGHAPEETVFLNASIFTPSLQFFHLVIKGSNTAQKSVPIPSLLILFYFNGL